MASSFELKLERAQEHLRAFDDNGRGWIETQPYSIVDEPDPYAHIEMHRQVDPPGAIPLLQFRRFRVERVVPVPDRLSLILGDCVHNLRSTLDHLALALARKQTPRMTGKKVEQSEFPVFHTRPMTTSERSKKIGSIDPAARAAIEALQPHHRGSAYRRDPLWRIHELDRVDKHRELALCAFHAGQGVGFNVPGEDEWNIQQLPVVISTPVMLQDDAILLRYAALPKNPEREVTMDPRLIPEISFAPGPVAALEPVVPTLQTLVDFVRDSVVGPLSQYL